MIGKKIQQIREEKGLSISELAKKANVSKSYLSEIERGLQTNPSLQFLNKISLSLDIHLETLLNHTSYENKFAKDLNHEWLLLISQAIEDGLEKKDFQRYAEYQSFLKKQDKLDSH
ncbi:helix-turn-helix domain-containing protein [Niallia endozanthoxylica]|uniref:Helix-turn-helix transcriptional regulator n=1 Tax=Niallia endozanthoxylica TaxID=2036016 RepID=A0A5J5I6C3_9BACI|nr:helix-turn-helix transcriptional regulator [Niallia endozanthoxylica]KAA9032387.1 helix-turn-helix transcriptional regulator [Niallia endozanthoxylica]